MKKLLFVLSVALLASCAKEEYNNDVNVNQTAGENLVEVTFTADIQTKTSVAIEGNKAVVTWNEGDEISIYYWDGAQQVAVTAEAEEVDGKSAIFKAALPAEVTDFWAVSPASNKAVLTYDETAGYTFAVNIPNTTDGSFQQANITAAKAVENDDNSYSLSFKNVSSILRFENGEMVPTNIAFRNVSGGKLYGSVTVTFAEDGSLESYVNSTDGAGSTSMSKMIHPADGAYYMPLLPGVSFPDGFVIKMATATDSDIPGALCDNDQIRGIERGQIMDIGSFEDKIVYDYYFTPETFADAQEFLKSSIWKTRLLDGATIHFAEGTYTVETAWALEFNKDGGVPNVVFEGTEGTIFDGGEAAGLFTFTKDANLTIRNITFQNAAAANGAVANVSAGNITFEGCSFQNNVATTNGGAVNVTGGSLKFKDCAFASNKAKTGGALYVKNTNNVEFENCSFTSNTATNSSVIALNTATLKFDRCLFSANKGTGDNGAVFYASTAPAVYLNSCYFISNTSTGKGATCVKFEVNTAKLGLNNVTISGGSGSNAGNASLISCKGSTVISNSTLWYNTGDYGCFAMGYNGDGDTAVIVNSIICNKDANDPGIGTNSSYNLRSAYNIISQAKLIGSGTLDKYVQENCVTGMFNGGNPFSFSSQTNVPGNNKLYTWDGTLTKSTDELTGTLTNPTLAQVETEIKNCSIGEDFLTWLEGIKTAEGKSAIEVDIRGVARNTDAMWPGAYQK